MIRTGVSGKVFLLVPAYPGCPGPKAVKRLCVCVCIQVSFNCCNESGKLLLTAGTMCVNVPWVIMTTK